MKKAIVETSIATVPITVECLDEVRIGDHIKFERNHQTMTYRQANFATAFIGVVINFDEEKLAEDPIRAKKSINIEFPIYDVEIYESTSMGETKHLLIKDFINACSAAKAVELCVAKNEHIKLPKSIIASVASTLTSLIFTFNLSVDQSDLS